MPAPSNADEFLDLVRKSGPVDGTRLEACLKKAGVAESAWPEPKALADILVREGLFTSFQADQIRHGKWKGFAIGPYKVLDRLGSGRMGSVYLCEDGRLNKVVAVKVLQTAIAQDASRRARFLLEARCQAAVIHGNIARAYFVGEEDGLSFIGMEYVDGSSLQQLVDDNGPLDAKRAAYYIGQAALGLQHVHARGLVHRDIEPGNILIDRTDTVKIIDFGLARALDDHSATTISIGKNTLVIEGLLSPDYVAPECAFNNSVAHRSDIYSLGATFYFCLAGRPPVPDSTVEQKLHRLQTHRPEPIRSFRPEIPAAMAIVLERMMAKDPAERYSSMQSVADALAPWKEYR